LTDELGLCGQLDVCADRFRENALKCPKIGDFTLDIRGDVPGKWDFVRTNLEMSAQTLNCPHKPRDVRTNTVVEVVEMTEVTEVMEMSECECECECE
jgi:hypothetical protein